DCSAAEPSGGRPRQFQVSPSSVHVFWRLNEMSESCLFCRIIRKEIPATIVLENDHCIAFRDINAQAPTHVLVVPRQHIASLDVASGTAVLGEVLLSAAQVARQAGIAEDG